MPMQKYYRHISPLSYFFSSFSFFFLFPSSSSSSFSFSFSFSFSLIIYFICLPSTRFCTTGHSLFAPFTSLLTTMLAKIYISLFVCLFWREGEGGRKEGHVHKHKHIYTKYTHLPPPHIYTYVYTFFFPPQIYIYIYIYMCISFFFWLASSFFNDLIYIISSFTGDRESVLCESKLHVQTYFVSFPFPFLPIAHFTLSTHPYLLR
ncbi:hypothetical protein DPX39_010017600 [Trypanosoma brucei equiperdum]|uniref:Uncharacterized protein n=1 Tax=Trypanosoma brucei equiperdum TaxID=630700 RepID=A0A3L6LDH1_9TRYP|nr:hypothetical protein DPX39_010017600 [Trypanosoma brucei equiperdum]